MNPFVTGCRLEPSILMILPCCTVTDRLHASGQSSGHAESTTEAGPPRMGSGVVERLPFVGVAMAYDNTFGVSGSKFEVQVAGPTATNGRSARFGRLWAGFGGVFPRPP